MAERKYTWHYVGGPLCGGTAWLSHAEACSVRQEYRPGGPQSDVWLAAYKASGVDAYRLEYLGMQRVPPTS